MKKWLLKIFFCLGVMIQSAALADGGIWILKVVYEVSPYGSRVVSYYYEPVAYHVPVQSFRCVRSGAYPAVEVIGTYHPAVFQYLERRAVRW